MHAYLQKKENGTGIPAQLKEHMEKHTGLSLDDVRVHYHSDMPKRLDALAYTQGNQVYIGAGQERHLPHELGHVVQQKLGKVRADTRHESGVMMNTDERLEREADVIGALHSTLHGTSHKRMTGNPGSGTDAAQRKIKPQSETWDDGKLIGMVRARMGKSYKDNYRKEIIDFYRRMKESSYSFTNEELLEKIISVNWNKRGMGEQLAERTKQEKQEELDLLYGGERGHMVSRHIEISDEGLRARIEGERGIERASAFATGVKGRDQALYTLEKLQPILKELFGSVLREAGTALVQAMPIVSRGRPAAVKQHLSDKGGIRFDTDIIEENGEFSVCYRLLLQKERGSDHNPPPFILSIDYSVTVNRMFQKRILEKERPGKTRRVYEPASVHVGRNRPEIKIGTSTTEEDINELVEESGISHVGVTFY